MISVPQILLEKSLPVIGSMASFPCFISQTIGNIFQLTKLDTILYTRFDQFMSICKNKFMEVYPLFFCQLSVTVMTPFRFLLVCICLLHNRPFPTQPFSTILYIQMTTYGNRNVNRWNMLAQRNFENLCSK